MKKCYDITGMSCAACSASVERAAKSVGINEPTVNLITGVLKVNIEDNTDIENRLFSAVKKAGFGISHAKSLSEKRELSKKKAKKEQTLLLVRFIVSVIFLLPLMYITMGHMISLPTPQFLNNPVVYSISQLVLTIPVIIINFKYFTGGFKHLIFLNPNMDSLIAISSSASLIYGIFAIIQIIDGNSHYIHDLYFETAAMIPTIVTLGKFLEGKSKVGTGKALDLLIDLTPKNAIVIRNGKESEIDVSMLIQNDTVIVKPGASFPCDGTVLSGESYVDESGLTGESIPVFKSYGSNVSAGTINGNGALTVKAEKVGDETTISGVISLVEQASASKPRISRLADKIASIFVPIVILISVVTFIIWILSGASFAFSMSRAICVLVISCPCSLGLATPLAITVGTGISASEGILIKNAEKLEQLGKVQSVLFDKTGTLTQGTPFVTDILPSDKYTEYSLLSICASLEAKSEHPLAKSIVNKANDMNIALIEVDSYEAIPGKGLCCKIGNDIYFGGNLTLLSENGTKVGCYINETFEKLSSQGKTPLFFTKNNEYIGCIAVRDESKTQSKCTILSLQEQDIDCAMLTGDNEVTANAIASEIGIKKVYASLSPSDKEKIVKDFVIGNKITAMVGDGINDSPALARADIGISISGGTDIALEASDVILMNEDISNLPKAIALSKTTISNIKLSLFWALLYNTIGIPIAAGLLYPIWNITLNPMIGAAAMSLSSICVVLNALSLKKFKYKHPKEASSC